MTERQQLINRLVHLVKTSISIRYYLHLLRNEKDPPSKQMLKSQLEVYAQETNCSEITFVMNSAIQPTSKIIIGGTLLKNKEPKGAFGIGKGGSEDQKSNHSTKASTDMSNFHYKNALVNYQKAIKESKKDKFYMQRMEANYMLENYNVAYALACKTGNPTLKFLMAVTSGHFQEANAVIPNLNLDGTHKGSETRDFVNKFCLVQLIMYVKLATSPSTDVIEMFDKLNHIVFNFKLPHISNIVDAFKAHDYGKAMQYINMLEPNLYDSLYAAPVSKEMIDAMIGRNIINFILPCSRISLFTISVQSSTNIATVCAHVINAIREGELTGKIDPETNEYIHFDSRYSEVVKLYNDLTVIENNVDRALFMFNAKKVVTEP